ncbi:MAG: hypothetical protein R3D44_03440 [Hyphomicrobiaceae bacterium]
MKANLQSGLGHGGTDFGREINGPSDVSLAMALRAHATRLAHAEARRYQMVMGAAGFFGGLLVVVPLVLWIAPKPAPAIADATAPVPMTLPTATLAAGASASPSLVSVPRIASQSEASDAQVAAPAANKTPSEHENTIEMARGLIRSGDILGARRLLGRPDIRESGQALFMMAETYDPSVLAALGAMGVHADTPTARRYYEAALAIGVVAAAPRLEALE